MLMSKETIIALYNESYDNGDPAMQIKSLAKANGVKAADIRAILTEAGCDVPDHIPKGPLRKEDDLQPAAGRDAKEQVGINEEIVVTGASHRKIELPIPDAVKETLVEKLDSIDEDINKHQAQIKVLEAKYATIAKYLQTK